MHECIGFPLPLKPWENSHSSTAKENEATVPCHSKSSLRVCTRVTWSAQLVQTLQDRTVDSCRLEVAWSKPPFQAEPARTAEPAPCLLGHPSLDSLQYVTVFLVLASPNRVTVLQVQFHKGWTEGEKNRLTCWLSSFSPRWGWSALLRSQTADSRSTCHPPRPPGLLSQSCFPARQSPASTGAWVYSIPDAGFSAWLCWTSFGSSQTISPACQGLSEWHPPPSSVPATLPSLELSANQFPTCSSLTKTSNNSGASINACETPLGTESQLDFISLSLLFWSDGITNLPPTFFST